jgi:hypothetical protein
MAKKIHEGDDKDLLHKHKLSRTPPSPIACIIAYTNIVVYIIIYIITYTNIVVCIIICISIIIYIIVYNIITSIIVNY